MGSLTNIIEQAAFELQDMTPHLTSADLMLIARHIIPDVFSRDRPLINVVDVFGQGNKRVTIDTTPTGNFPSWEIDWSQIWRIGYPINEDNPQWLRQDYYVVEQTVGSNVWQIRFRHVAPPTTVKFRVEHTMRHTINTTLETTTVFTIDERACALKIAKEAMDRVANKFSQLADIAIGKMRMDYGRVAKAAEIRSQAIHVKYVEALSRDMSGTNAYWSPTTAYFDHQY